MALISFSFTHGQTLEEARCRLEAVVGEVSGRFSVRRVEWASDRNRVMLEVTGARIEMWVDAQQVHVTGDIPALAGLLTGPLTSGLRQMLGAAFRKQLP
jgi:Putative polyhydroxyalkanoic acid system protein (PHA_gran_rgn)